MLKKAMTAKSPTARARFAKQGLATRAALDRTVDAHIKTLRAKLREAAPEADPIITHRGLGYSLREE